MQSYYAHGKLLLSGEYAVLKGSLGLAIPTCYGQHLHFEPTDTSSLLWKSFDCKNKIWFQAEFDHQLSILATSDDSMAAFLQHLLRKGFALSGESFQAGTVSTLLEFDRSWGLGSSSTLTYLIALWLGANQMKLHDATQNGSGYDIACASAKTAIVYRKTEDIYIHPLRMPEVYNQAFFVHLNRKQQSKPEVLQFLNSNHSKSDLNRISEISTALTFVSTKAELISLLTEHEAIMSSLLNKPTVQAAVFPEFKGIVKSLGAWGGDFVMAVGDDAPNYFKSKGYHTIIPFDKMAL